MNILDDFEKQLKKELKLRPDMEKNTLTSCLLMFYSNKELEELIDECNRRYKLEYGAYTIIQWMNLIDHIKAIITLKEQSNMYKKINKFTGKSM